MMTAHTRRTFASMRRFAATILLAPLLLTCCDSAAFAQFGVHRNWHGYHSPVMGAYGYGQTYGYQSLSISTPWATFSYGRTGFPQFHDHGFDHHYGYPGWGHSHHHHHSVYSSPFLGGYPTSTVFVVPQPVFQPSSVVNATIRENNARWQQPLNLQPEPRRFRRPQPSTPAAKQKALRHVRLGDGHFRNGSYLLAHSEYRKAAEQAEDMSEPQVRLAVVLSSLRRFTLAVKHLKRAVQLDPDLPANGDSLATIYGAGGDLNKATDLRKATVWVREDLIDPDRLFLLGVLLYFDDSSDNAAALFEAALRLAGEGEHLKVFLRAQPNNQPAANPPNGNPVPANPAIGPILGQPRPAQPNVGVNPLGPAPQVPPLPPLPVP